MVAPASRTSGRSSRLRLVATALVVLAILAAACGGSDDTIRLSRESSDLSPSRDSIETDADGMRVDGLEFATFEGETRNTAEYGGRPLVINFFAATCPPCIAEMPHFETVFNEVEGEVSFLGLSQDSTAAAALDLVAQTGITYDVGWDRDLEIFERFGGWAMPTTVFVRPDGGVAEVFPGALTVDALRDKVEAIRS